MATAESTRLSDYWQQQIAVWEQSGLTQKAFCEQHALNYYRFGYWRRKYREQIQGDAVQARKGFIPVQYSPERVAGGLSLTLPNGIRVQGIDADNLPLLSHLLRQL